MKKIIHRLIESSHDPVCMKNNKKFQMHKNIMWSRQFMNNFKFIGNNPK